jgi:AcrR family transcriptional regulator
LEAVRRRQTTKKPKRQENAEAKYSALLHAAARVVGEHGYMGASISRITAEANVAQGTFYSYFENRQDLFDQLLPKMGVEMLEFIKARTRGVDDTIERERKGFLAFFDFIVQNPDFLRVLNEAEQLAPAGHKAHFDIVSQNYLAALMRDWDHGQYPGFDAAELEVIVYILLAARSYLALRYARDGEKIVPIPGWVTDAYIKFVMYGLCGQPPSDGEGKDGRRKR